MSDARSELRTEGVQIEADAQTTSSSSTGRFVGVLTGALASKWAFRVVLAVALLNAAAVAVVLRHFSLYDERYHFGIISIYAGQLSPFIENSGDYPGYGDLDRYGSFLYHYLMSFPYRICTSIGVGEYGSVLVLRGVSVVLSVASLIWFRKTLLLLGVGRAAVTVALLCFTVLPIWTQVASTINYDNLLQFLGALFFYLCVKVVISRSIRPEELLAIVTVGSAASLTKYTFLPVFLGSIVVLAVEVGLRLWRGRSQVTPWAGTSRRPAFWLAAASFALVAAFFVERYVFNVIGYGTPTPDCGRLHPDSYCQAYGVWARNTSLEVSRDTDAGSIGGFISYIVQQWIPGLNSTATLVGTELGARVVTSPGPPITQAFVGVGTAIVGACVVFAIGWLFTRPAWRVVIAGATVFTVALLVLNYGDFLKFGQPLGVQGRYFLLVLPFVIAIGAVVAGRTLDSFTHNPAGGKIVLTVTLLILLSQGGGALDLLSVGGDDWFEPSSPISAMTSILRSVARAIVIGV